MTYLLLTQMGFVRPFDAPMLAPAVHVQNNGFVTDR